MLHRYLPNKIGNELLGKLRKMRTLVDDDDEITTSGPSKSQASQQPAWMRNLHERCGEWLTQLPPVIATCRCRFARVLLTLFSVNQYITQANW